MTPRGQPLLYALALTDGGYMTKIRPDQGHRVTTVTPKPFAWRVRRRSSRSQRARVWILREWSWFTMC